MKSLHIAGCCTMYGKSMNFKTYSFDTRIYLFIYLLIQSETRLEVDGRHLAI